MRNILVVDDNRDTTDLVKFMLGINQYSCTTANSGFKCLEQLRRAKFDLVLRDMVMPVMN